MDTHLAHVLRPLPGMACVMGSFPDLWEYGPAVCKDDGDRNEDWEGQKEIMSDEKEKNIECHCMSERQANKQV